MLADGNLDLPEKVAYLSEPAAFPERPYSVQTIETHFAWIFLADSFVYKLKKPARTPEFDLTSAESRRLNCELEIALNRRLAGETYIAVVPLSREGRRLVLGSNQHPIDWLVRMRRLPAELTLERLLPSMSIDDPRLVFLLETLCRFYRRTPSAPWTGYEYRHRLQHQCTTLAAQLMLPVFEPQHALIRNVAEQQRGFAAKHAALIEGRVSQRHVRDAHGDLRPEHVFLTEPPQIIDCLEFSSELRQLDTAEEIIFLALECERLGYSDVGKRLHELYSTGCDDPVPPCLLEFYLSRRALVRAWLSIRHLEECSDDTRVLHWTSQAVWYIGRAARAIEQAG
jgi:aminoglycoside phosphotransferase family enzyme